MTTFTVLLRSFVVASSALEAPYSPAPVASGTRTVSGRGTDPHRRVVPDTAARPARPARPRRTLEVRTLHPAGLAPGPRRHRPRPALGRHGGAGPAGRRQPRLVLDLGLRPLPHGARARRGGHPRGVVAHGRLRRRHGPGPPGPDVHVHGLPQPRLPREGRRDGRRHLGGPPRDGHRRRLVRARVARLRLRLPEGRRAARGAARGRRDHARRCGPPGRRRMPGSTTTSTAPCAPPPAAGRRGAREPAQRHPAVGRRRRREEDAADRGGVRRLHQLRRRARGVRAQERDPARALRGRRPRLRRDRAQRQLQRRHRARPRPRCGSASTGSGTTTRAAGLPADVVETTVQIVRRRPARRHARPDHRDARRPARSAA